MDFESIASANSATPAQSTRHFWRRLADWAQFTSRHHITTSPRFAMFAMLVLAAKNTRTQTRNDSSSGIRATVREANHAADRPANKIAKKMTARSIHGIEALPTNQCGSVENKAAATPIASPATSSHTVSSRIMRDNFARPNPTACINASSRFRSSTLRNCTAAKPNVPSSKPQPAQRLERAQVSVLHAHETRQRGRGRSSVKAIVLKLIFQVSGDF